MYTMATMTMVYIRQSQGLECAVAFSVIVGFLIFVSTCILERVFTLIWRGCVQIVNKRKVLS